MSIIQGAPADCKGIYTVQAGDTPQRILNLKFDGQQAKYHHCNPNKDIHSLKPGDHIATPSD